MWARKNQTPLKKKVKEREWKRISQSLRKEEGDVVKTAFDWNPQGYRRRGRPTTTWRQTVDQELRWAGKTWREVKATAPKWSVFRGLVDVPWRNKTT